MSEKTMREGLIMLHPIRWKILSTLKKEGSPMYIDSIAKMIGTDRRLVSFHLATLEEYGFLESEFKVVEEPKSKGKAGRFYKLTAKVDKLRPELAKIIKG
jgi:predicted ArsR family transcriptional regulator